ncbi:MAG: M28 family peptidase, partial [Planctomycetota bacterium]|nr:M28 family peptidase [Planctomycetota bacterium]
MEPLEARQLLAAVFGPLLIRDAAEAPLGDALRVPEDARAALLASRPTVGSPLFSASPPAGQAPYGAAWNETSEYMLGDVWVSVVLLESNNSIDPQTENWTATEINKVKSGIQEGLTWWQDTLAAQTPKPLAGLKFHLDFTYADAPVATGYEPINRPHTDEGLWIGSFLQQVGHPTANGIWQDMTQWDHDQRVAHNADWAYTIFVVNSLVDPDGMFTDNYFAYAYVGGPFAVLTYDNGGWGISRLGQVLAHETGHIFYALDEYSGAGNYTERSGYYNTQNLNASDGNPNPSSRVASLMAEANLQDTAYSHHTSSPTSLQMLGWQDTDTDGIFDVLDVPPTLTGSGSYQASAGRYEFTGISSVQTLPNLNPPSGGNAITTNKVDRLQYRLDGGSWTNGNTYSGYTVNVAQNVTADSRLHTIEFRTVVAETGLTSAVWTATFGTPDTTPPGVSGLAPADDATQVARDTNLVITFNEDIRKGSGNIVMKRTSDNLTVETIAVTSGAVTVAGTTATIDPALTLGENTGYYVQVLAGAFADLSGNPFAGFTAATTWNFTSAANLAPVVVQPIHDVSVDEDAVSTVIDLGPVFNDPDLRLGDTLTYTTTVTLPIDSLVSQVSQTSYATLHQDLLYTHTGNSRYLGAPEHDLARDNIAAYFASLGLQTSLEPFVFNGQTYYNVVAVQPGTSRPQDVYLVGAHYDSAAAGAGADDNASGTAAVMELARVLSQHQFDATFVFAAFDREEQGLYGSRAYAASHSSDHILGMLSLDMVAYNTAGTGHDTVRLYDWNGAGTIKSNIAAAFAAYSGGLLTLDSGAEFGSDHYWFEQGGFDAALVSEYAMRDNPYYHRAGDVVESANYLDYAYATKVTRGVLGYLATAAGVRDPSNLLTATRNGQDLVLNYAANANGLVEIRVLATDSLGLTAADTFRVTVNAVNDAPVLDSSGELTLLAINANATGNPGTLVRDILVSAGGDRLTDVDWGALEGLAVTAADTTHGTWQFSLNGGGTWTALGSPTETAARLLGSDTGTRIRFVPSVNWSGTVNPGLTFRAWDHTQGFQGQVADASIGGGVMAFSASVENAAITVNPPPSVIGRYVFYNNSAWDGKNPLANADDDLAIALHPPITDASDATLPGNQPKQLGKQALLPGQTATFANYTSYSRGLNGIMIDVARLAGAVTTADFVFKVGNSNDPSTWAAAPAPQYPPAVRAGAGTAGSDRITLIWADDDPYTALREPGSISQQWLQVTLRATANTGLAADDVFYFGNAIAESGNSTVETNVDTNDEIGARNHPHAASTPAARDDVYDYDRDQQVNANDELLARHNSTSAFTRLKLITVPSLPAGAPPPSDGGPLQSGAPLDGQPRSSTPDSLPLQIDIGEHVLLPNLAQQTISVSTTSDVAVQGVVLNVQVADGFPAAADSTVDGPKITAVDIVGAGTVFGSVPNTSPNVIAQTPQVWVVGTTTSSGTVEP